MRLRRFATFRALRWVVLVPWVCAMDDGCAAIEALHEGRAVALATSKAKPHEPAEPVKEKQAS